MIDYEYEEELFLNKLEKNKTTKGALNSKAYKVGLLNEHCEWSIAEMHNWRNRHNKSWKLHRKKQYRDVIVKDNEKVRKPKDKEHWRFKGEEHSWDYRKKLYKSWRNRHSITIGDVESFLKSFNEGDIIEAKNKSYGSSKFLVTDYVETAYDDFNLKLAQSYYEENGVNHFCKKSGWVYSYREIARMFMIAS